MANTENDLADMALEIAGVKPANQAANVEDVALVKRNIPFTLALLIGKNIAISSDTADMSDIPDTIMLPLARCVAAQCAEGLMLSEQKKADLEAGQVKAIRDLTLIYRQGFPGKRLKVEHFWRRGWPYTNNSNFTTGT